MKTNNKKKIAYVVSMFPCWSETFILNELIEHKKAGLDLCIFSLKQFSENLVHEEAIPFIFKTIYPHKYFDPRLFMYHLFLLFSNPKQYISIFSKILKFKTSSLKIKIASLAVFALSAKFIFHTRKSKVHHIHAHFATFPSLLAWIVSQYTGITFSLTVHAHDIYVNQDILRLIAKDVNFIAAISKFNVDFMSSTIGEWIRAKTTVIHCGIDISRFDYRSQIYYSASNNDVLEILSIGRLSGIKGFNYLIDTCKLLENEGLNFRCHIAGDGPLLNQLVSKVNSLGMKDKVIFLGPQTSDEVKRLLKSCHVFILACARDKVEGHDGIPIVFMEAMASGVPVIGTSLSGIPELIKDGETGICVEPENPESLKDAIIFFVNNPVKVERMRVNARKLIEKEFNININAKKLRRLFLTIDSREGNS